MVMQDEALGSVKIDLRRYIDALKARSFTIFFISALFLLMGLALASFWPQIYESTTKVALKELKIIDDSDLFKSTSQLPIPQKQEVLRQILVSRSYVQAVLEQLNWVEYYESGSSPAERSRFLMRVAAHVQPVIKTDITGSELVEIIFGWTDPIKARDFVEKLRDHWIDQIVESYKRTHKEQLVRMETILAQQNADLRTAQKQLDDFQTANNLPLDLSQNSKQTQVQEYTKTIAELKAKVTGQEQKLKGLREALEKTPKESETKSQLPNPDYVTAQQRVVAAEKSIESYKLKGWTDKHPFMQRAKAELQQAMDELGGLEKFLDNEIKTEPNEAYTKLHGDYIELDADYNGNLKALAQQQEALEQLQKEVQNYPFLQNELNRLKNNVDVDQQIWNKTQVDITPMRNRVASFQQSGVPNGDPLASGVFEILEEPVAAPEPAKPMALIFIAASLVFGLGLGVVLVIAQDTLKRTVSSADDVRRLVPVPVLAAIGPIATDLELHQARVHRLFSMAMSLLVLFTLAATIYVCTYHSDVLPHNLVAWVNDLKKSLG